MDGLPLLGSLAGRKRQGANYGRGCTTERERTGPVQGMYVAMKVGMCGSILSVYIEVTTTKLYVNLHETNAT